MSQHDLTIANQGFPAFRSDLNAALQALGSCQSGISAPSPTFANQLWYDTTNDILKMRNEDNDAWINLFTLDQTGDLVSLFKANFLSSGAGSASAPAIYPSGDTNTGVFFPSADTVAIATNGAEVLRITSAGNAGVGTSSPTAPLDISRTTGSTTAYGATQVSAVLAGTNTVTNPSLLFASTNTNYRVQNYFDTATGSMSWKTCSDGTTYVEKMRITNAGNVGIGTSSPQSKLDIGGNTTSSGVADISISRTGTPSFSVGNGANIQFSNTDATTSDYGMVQYSDGVFQLFGYNNAGAAWVGGNLASGITSSVAATNNNQTGLFYQNDGNIVIAHANALPTGFFMAFQYGGTNAGYIAGVSAGAGVQYITTSDYRLKEDITPMTGALDTVSKLKPVTYTWKTTGEKSDGFIAHELQEVLPNAVSGEKDAVDKDGNIIAQGVDTSYVVATLTAAIQEQQAIIKDLKSRIETLEAK